MWTKNTHARIGLCLLMIGCGGDPLGDLILQLNHPNVEIRRAAARTLSAKRAADDRVIAALTKAAQDDDAEVRRLSIYALGKLGPSAESSSSVVKRALQDRESSVRVRAALTIQRIDPQDLSGVPVLVDAVRRGDGRVLLEVGALGPEAAWAVPTLIGLLSHEVPQVRALAARTLGRIGPAASDAKAALQRALRDSNAAVQDAAQRGLDRIQPLADQ